MRTYLYIGLEKIDTALDFYIKSGFQLMYALPATNTEDFKKYFYFTGDKYAFAIIKYKDIEISVSHITADSKNHGGIQVCFKKEEYNEIKELIKNLSVDSTDSIHNFDKFIPREHYCFYDKFGVAWIFAIV